MSEHVVERIVDYLEGRLEGGGAREFEAHLAACPECAADVRWAREFREAAAAQGLRHPRPDRIVELADSGAPPATEAERRHLETCAACAREVGWARDLQGLEATSARQPDPRVFADRGRRRTLGLPIPLGPRGWALAGLAVAAAVLAVIFAPGGGRHLSELAHIEPLPVQVTRAPPGPGPFEESRIRGLEAYLERDYAGARTALRRATDREPRDAEVALYLGSAALLLGDARGAMGPLRRAAENTEDPALREEALWQLANAALAAGRAAAAREALRDVVALERKHRAEAEALLARIGEAGE